jgi:hypothetical protein
MGKKTSFRLIGTSGVTRRAVSYTPAAAHTIKQFTVWLKRTRVWNWIYGGTNTTSTIEWEIRSNVAGTKPGTAANTLLDSGTFDYRYHASPFREDRLVEYTIQLDDPLTLAASTIYWFILKIPDDADTQAFPLGWADTYDDDDDADVHVAYYTGAAWVNDDAAAYDLEISVLDDQAGVQWHVVLNSNGYMTPDYLASYQVTQSGSSLLATRGGQSEWSQMRYPYTSISQDDWTSGGGQLTMEDLHAFLYSVRCDTTVPRQAILGPKVNRTGLLLTTPLEYDPTAIYAVPLPDPDLLSASAEVKYYAQKIAFAAQTTIDKFAIRIGRMPYPARHAIQVGFYTDNAGSPGTLINPPGWKTIVPGVLLDWMEADGENTVFEIGTYWLVVRTDQGFGHSPEYRIVFDQDASAGGGAAKYSTAGAAWSAWDKSMAYRINKGSYSELNGDVIAYVYGTAGAVTTLFCAAGKKVYRWDNGTAEWLDHSLGIEGGGEDTTTANITDIAIFNEELWVAQGYANNARYYDDTGWNDGGDAFKVFGVGKGYLWASDSVNTVKKYNGVSWSSAITAGENLYDITSITNYVGRLLIGKEDGIWEVDDNDLCREYLLYRPQAGTENAEGMCVWSGMLFIPVLQELWRWQGSSYRAVGPTDRNSGVSNKIDWKIDDMHPMPNLLWAAGTDNGTDFGGLMAYNGLGWHYLARHWRDNGLSNKAVYATSEIGSEIRIWFAEGKYPCYIDYPLTGTSNRYDWSSATYTLDGGYLVTSWIDGGLKDALKFWNRVTVVADVPAGTYIQVYMAADGEDWESRSLDYLTLLGTIDADTLSNNGEATLMFPDGFVAKSIQLAFIMYTDDNTKTPRLKAYNIEMVGRVQPAYIHTFRILLADRVTKLDGTTETSRTGQDMWIELQRAAETNEPILLSLPFHTVRGSISNLTMGTYQYAAKDGGNPKWERVAVVSFIEML